MNNIDILKQTIEEQGKPSNIAIFKQPNLIYYTNFSGATALFIPRHGEPVLYVSGVNYEQAKAEVRNATVKLLRRGENVMEEIAKQAVNKKIFIDSLPVESWQGLVKAVGGEQFLEVADGVIQEKRKIKNVQEVELIKQACRLADLGMQKASETIKVGIKERTVSAEAEYAMRNAGSDGTAFDTIVSSGQSCAYPHGTFQEKIIEDGDFIVVDLGATHKYYRSDITRSFIAGNPSEKQRRIYETVKLAQEKAIEVIRPGVSAKAVDGVARQIIEESGFIDLFVHNLGHGVGVEIHEAPILSPTSGDILEAGNVITVEPGVYLPGFGGVRIEDTVLVTEKGAEKLTHAPYSIR